MATKFAFRWDHDRPTDDVGHDAAVGAAVGRAADEENAAGEGSESFGPGEEVAHHTLDGGAGQQRRGDVAPKSRQHARGMGSVGSPLAVEVGHQYEAAGAGRGLQGHPVEAVVVQAEESRHGIRDLGRVHGADQGQVAAGRVGETSHAAGGVRRWPSRRR